MGVMLRGMLILLAMAMMIMSITSGGISQSQERLPPLILVPGAGGNQLEAKLSDDYHGSTLLCRTFGISYWFRLWLKTPSLLPPLAPCFAERIRLEYNAGTKKFHNPPGIETRVPNFGSTESMEYLDPTFKFISGYMNNLVDSLKDQGYKSQRTLFGAPYDFRYAPGPNAAEVALEYLSNLKSLVEKSSKMNGNRPVVLLAHNLGSLWVLSFLNSQTREWKQRFIGRFIAVGAPWGGSVQEMRLFASGYGEGVSFLDPLVLRDEQRSSESNLWMLPVAGVFGDRPLVIGFRRSYSAQDIKVFFDDIGFPQGFEHYITRVPELVENLTAPGVAVSLIYGSGVQTPETLVYDKPGFDYQPQVRYGDGDGTINLCSLTRVVNDWQVNNMHEFKVMEIEDRTHTSILQDGEALNLIVQEVLRETAPLTSTR